MVAEPFPPPARCSSPLSAPPVPTSRRTVVSHPCVATSRRNFSSQLRGAPLCRNFPSQLRGAPLCRRRMLRPAPRAQRCAASKPAVGFRHVPHRRPLSHPPDSAPRSAPLRSRSAPAPLPPGSRPAPARAWLTQEISEIGAGVVRRSLGGIRTVGKSPEKGFLCNYTGLRGHWVESCVRHGRSGYPTSRLGGHRRMPSVHCGPGRVRPVFRSDR